MGVDCVGVVAIWVGVEVVMGVKVGAVGSAEAKEEVGEMVGVEVGKVDVGGLLQAQRYHLVSPAHNSTRE